MEGYKIKRERKCPAEKAGHSIMETYEFYFTSEKSNFKYVIEATYHKENFFAVKFYCRTHKLSKNRYSLQTCTNEPFKIMITCTQVLPILLEKYPKCSFVAIGSRSITQNKIEDPQDTIRFQMYRRHILQKFEDSQFIILDIPENSSISLINIEDDMENYSLTKDDKFFQREIMRKAIGIKNVILECYNDIHIPD